MTLTNINGIAWYANNPLDEVAPWIVGRRWVEDDYITTLRRAEQKSLRFTASTREGQPTR
jgi:hypothetical protein